MNDIISQLGNRDPIPLSMNWFISQCCCCNQQKSSCLRSASDSTFSSLVSFILFSSLCLFSYPDYLAHLLLTDDVFLPAKTAGRIIINRIFRTDFSVSELHAMERHKNDLRGNRKREEVERFIGRRNRMRTIPRLAFTSSNKRA